MATNKVSAGEAVTASKENNITIGTTEPTSPTDGWLWIDTSLQPPALKVWDDTDDEWRMTGTVAVHATVHPSDPYAGMLSILTGNGGNVFMRNSVGWQELGWKPQIGYGNDSIDAANVAFQGLTSFNLIAGPTYRMNFKCRCSAGGTGIGDIYLALLRTSGAGTMTLIAAAACSFWDGGIDDRAPTMFSTTQLELHPTLGSNGGAVTTEWFEAWAIFTVSDTGVWAMSGSEVNADTNDPAILESLCEIVPVAT